MTSNEKFPITKQVLLDALLAQTELYPYGFQLPSHYHLAAKPDGSFIITSVGRNPFIELDKEAKVYKLSIPLWVETQEDFFKSKRVMVRELSWRKNLGGVGYIVETDKEKKWVTIL